MRLRATGQTGVAMAALPFPFGTAGRRFPVDQRHSNAARPSRIRRRSLGC